VVSSNGAFAALSRITNVSCPLLEENGGSTQFSVSTVLLLRAFLCSHLFRTVFAASSQAAPSVVRAPPLHRRTSDRGQY
jgi:hypothetical protein